MLTFLTSEFFAGLNAGSPQSGDEIVLTAEGEAPPDVTFDAFLAADLADKGSVAPADRTPDQLAKGGASPVLPDGNPQDLPSGSLHGILDGIRSETVSVEGVEGKPRVSDAVVPSAVPLVESPPVPPMWPARMPKLAEALSAAGFVLGDADQAPVQKIAGPSLDGPGKPVEISTPVRVQNVPAWSPAPAEPVSPPHPAAAPKEAGEDRSVSPTTRLAESMPGAPVQKLANPAAPVEPAGLVARDVAAMIDKVDTLAGSPAQRSVGELNPAPRPDPGGTVIRDVNRLEAAASEPTPVPTSKRAEAQTVPLNPPPAAIPEPSRHAEVPVDAPRQATGGVAEGARPVPGARATTPADGSQAAKVELPRAASPSPVIPRPPVGEAVTPARASPDILAQTNRRGPAPDPGEPAQIGHQARLNDRPLQISSGPRQGELSAPSRVESAIVTEKSLPSPLPSPSPQSDAPTKTAPPPAPLLTATVTAPTLPLVPVATGFELKSPIESAMPDIPDIALAESAAGSGNPPRAEGITFRTPLPSQTLRQIVEVLTQAPDRPVELMLNPEELGRVRLTLTTGEAGASVAVLAERAETLELLRRNADLLASDLREIGYGDVAFDFGQGQAHESNSSEGDGRQDEGRASGDETEADQTDPVQITLGDSRADGLDLRL